MIEWPLILLGGLLGSAHCIGMCGGFAMAIGAGANSWSQNLGRQLIYSLGRVTTYAAGGAIAGFGGMRLARAWEGWINVPAVLALVAGVLLITQGVLATGLWRPSNRHFQHLACLSGSMFRSFLSAPGWSGIFVAGLFTGFLPCGLVYAYIALATSAGDFLKGAAVMACFGLGTWPMMILTGAGASLVSVQTRRKLMFVAAWCVVATGAITIARGYGYLELPSRPAAQTCPFCR
ncbi:MAG: sulfite exporter TauE/SafE family protein [Planctomycetia bacterium]|nr:sulfite exporter TauE/SafE family protein [Planctomycetia bacterium]